MTESRLTRHRLDDLRRLATDLASRVDVLPARASALATYLLWFDAAGASSHGIATLPDWLDRIERKEIDAKAEGRAGFEHSGTALFDAKNGLGPLALQAAAGVAAEKARDVGVGLVRVRNVGPTGPAGPIASGLAIGPFVALVVGPGPSLAIAAPTAEGLPALHDSALSGEGADLGDYGPWVSSIVGGDGWLILAVSVPALEALGTFHERVGEALGLTARGSGPLRPGALEASRREARERGVTIEPEAEVRLARWAERLGVAWPPGLVNKPG